MYIQITYFPYSTHSTEYRGNKLSVYADIIVCFPIYMSHYFLLICRAILKIIYIEKQTITSVFTDSLFLLNFCEIVSNLTGCDIYDNYIILIFIEHIHIKGD